MLVSQNLQNIEIRLGPRMYTHKFWLCPLRPQLRNSVRSSRQPQLRPWVLSAWICLPAAAETCLNKQKYWPWMSLANEQLFDLLELWIGIDFPCCAALQTSQFWYLNTLLKDLPICSKRRNYPQSTHWKTASRNLWWKRILHWRPSRINVIG